MDIPIRKVCEAQHSQQDVCFHVQSQILPSSKGQYLSKYRMSYKRSFEPLLAQTISKKTLNTSWTQRYFVLTSTRLLYYGDSSMKELKGCFILASLVADRLSVKFTPPQICFSVCPDDEASTEKTLLLLKVDDANAFKEWEKTLSKVMASLHAINPQDLRLFPKIKKQSLLESNSKLGISEGNFWNRMVISTQELLKYGSHMDIVLLRSKNPIFYLHRFFMRSHYDHVGVLVKDETQRLFVLQAIQSKGVCLSSLESLLLTFNEEYQQLAYRKLLVQGNASLKIEQLQNYINNILGSKYELSITKLLLDNAVATHPQSDPQKKEETNQQKEQEKTYFCSELVADIYLKFGILAEGKSNNFWPKDFEEDSMVLCKDFKLGPLLQVQLEDPPDSSEISSN